MPDEWLEFQIEMKDGEIDVDYQDGAVEFTAEVNGPVAKATAGFFVPENSSADFRSFVLKDEGKR